MLIEVVFHTDKFFSRIQLSLHTFHFTFNQTFTTIRNERLLFFIHVAFVKIFIFRDIEKFKNRQIKKVPKDFTCARLD